MSIIYNVYNEIGLYALIIFSLYSCLDTNEKGSWHCKENNNCVYKEYFNDGQLMLSSDYVGSVQHGNTILYYPNGNIQRIAKFSNGINQDTVKEFYSDGIARKEFSVKEGILEGYYIEYNAKGIPIVYGKHYNGKKFGHWWTSNEMYVFSKTGLPIDSSSLEVLDFYNLKLLVPSSWVKTEYENGVQFIRNDDSGDNIVLSRHSMNVRNKNICDQIVADLINSIDSQNFRIENKNECGIGCCDITIIVLNDNEKLISRIRYFGDFDNRYSIAFTMSKINYNSYLPFIEMTFRVASTNKKFHI